MSISNLDPKAREELGNFESADDLFAAAFSQPSNQPTDSESTVESDLSQEQNDDQFVSPMDAFEQVKQDLAEQGESEDIAAADNGSEESSNELPSNETATEQEDSAATDIETVFLKGAEGRKQKLEINYSDRKAIKQAFVKAAGMRKFQAERDKALTSYKELEESHKGLKDDFDKIEKAFEANGPKGIVELLGGSEAWEKAVNDELEHREYVNNLSAEEKFKLEMQKRDEAYQSQLTAERMQREAFQKQVQEEKEAAELQKLEAKLHPAFDRYRFAGKLGDPATENLYDEAIWGKVKQRLGEYDDSIELSQAVIDKEFRTVSNMFKKHIKQQAEKQVQKTVENKKVETAQRAQVAAKKGLSGSTTQRKILESLTSGNLGSALDLWTQNK